MNIQELEARIKEIKADLSEIRAATVERDLSEDERNSWTELNEELERNEASLAERVAVRDRVEELAESPEHREEEKPHSFQTRSASMVRGNDVFDLSTIRGSITDPAGTAHEFKERAHRVIDEIRGLPHEAARTEPTQEHLERLVNGRDGAEVARHILITGGPTYSRAWLKAVGRQPLSNEERTALSLSNAHGGYLLPYTLDPTIIPVTDGAVNPLRTMSRTVQTTTNVWKGVTSEGMTAAYRSAEGEETTDDSPEFAQPEIACHAADAFAQWTYEFGQDFGAIAPEIAKMVQIAKDKLEATKLLEGGGTNEPYGVLKGAEEVVETATKESFAEADVYSLEEGLGDYYTSNAAFLGHRAIYHKISQFEGEGGPLWQTWNSLQSNAGIGPSGRVPRLLLEYPAYRISTMSSTLGKTEGEEYKANVILLFGNFDYYVIADRIGMMAKPVDNVPGENGRPTGQEGLYFFWRNGAKVMSKKAFRKLKTKAS